MHDELQKQKEFQDAQKKAMRDKIQKGLEKHIDPKDRNQAPLARNVAKTLAKMASPWGLISLLSEVSFFSDWMYLIAFLFAISKDFFDLLGALIVFLYPITVIMSFLSGIVIGLMILLGSFSNNSASLKQKNIIKGWIPKIMVLLGVTSLEIIPGISLLPLETFAVIIIYFMMLLERKKAKELYTKRRWSVNEIEEMSENYI